MDDIARAANVAMRGTVVAAEQFGFVHDLTAAIMSASGGRVSPEMAAACAAYAILALR